MTNQEAVIKLTNIANDDMYSWHPSILEAFRMAVDALRGSEGDCISRQAVRLIESDSDAYPQEWNNDYEAGFTDALNKVLALPSVQPEIVRCKDCKHRDPEDHKCDCGHTILWQLPRDDKWFCADAERKEGEAEC